MEEIKTLKEMENEASLIMDKNDNALPNVFNVVYLLENSEVFNNLIKYDAWTDVMMYKENNDFVPFEDHHFIALQCLFQNHLKSFARISDAVIRGGVELFANRHKSDRGLAYIDGLPKWDKKERLKDFMYKAYGVKDSYIKEQFDIDAGDYHAVVGANFFKQMVARIIEPGVQQDNMLVIEGEQGKKKTKSLHAIAGNLNMWETSDNPNSKDFLISMKGNLIVEFTEGVIMNKKDAASLKGFVTTRTDVYRKPYGRISVRVPRRNVFTMTTNNQEYLKDDTGNRRFIPIYAHEIDINYINDNRDQLFAEALYRYKMLKELFYEYPENVLSAVHGGKMIKSPYFDTIRNWLINPKKNEASDFNVFPIDDGFSVMDIWTHCLDGQKTYIHPGKQAEIAGVLKELGFEKKRVRRHNVQMTLWFNTGKIIPKQDDTLKLENIVF